MKFIPSKFPLYALAIMLVWFLPSFANAYVLQSISNATGSVEYNGQIVGQAFNEITEPTGFTVYASRQDAGGTATTKVFNIYRIRCFDDVSLVSVCPETGLDGSGYILWNNKNQLNFTNTDTSVPQTGNRVIGQNATITTPFDSKTLINIPLLATTTHTFMADNYYFIEFAEVFFGADSFYFWGSKNSVYPTTFRINGVASSTSIDDMYLSYSYVGEGIGGEFEPGATTPAPKNIEILNPTYGTTTVSNTVTFQIKYKTPFSIDFRPTTTRHFEIVDAVNGDVEFEYDVLLEANSAENLTISTSTTLTSGSKYVRAMYLDMSGNNYSEVDEVFFNVATNTYFIATGLDNPRSDPSDLTQIDCSTFDVGCQFQKAITYLFVPPQNTLDKFSNLWQTIAEKKPFGYVTVTINQLSQLNTSGASAFNLGTLPFMDSVFTPFRTLLAGILWGVFAVYFYQRRLIHLDI